MKAHVLAIFTALTLASASPRAEEALGRLFFTPERRLALDHQRQFNIQEKQETPADPTLTINGVVTRSSGKRTVWVNGSAHDEGEPRQGVNIMPNRIYPGKIIVQSEDGSVSAAGVGDTLNRTTGEATKLLRDGRISVRTVPLK